MLTNREQSTILSQLTSTQRIRERFTVADEMRTRRSQLEASIGVEVWHFSLLLRCFVYYLRDSLDWCYISSVSSDSLSTFMIDIFVD